MCIEKYQDDNTIIPQHIAFITDGNGRWAKKRGLPRSFGHKAGSEVVKTIIQACLEIDIKIVTIYAFSTENWSRPDDEVAYLMNLFIKFFKDVRGEAKKIISKSGILDYEKNCQMSYYRKLIRQ